MKRKMLIPILCMCAAVSGCSAGSETGTSVDSYIQDTASDIYIGSGSFCKVSMGTCVDGEQTKLCTVVMPADYYAFSSYTEIDGSIRTMREIEGKLLSNAVTGLENSTVVPSTLVLTAQGDEYNSYTFAIVEHDTAFTAAEKCLGTELSSAEADFGTINGCRAYVYVADKSGQFDIVAVCELDDDWTLMIENGGRLIGKMPEEQIGRELCRMVSPSV